MPSLRRRVLVSVVLVFAAGCGGNAASSLARAPEFRADGQSKCGVTKSQAHPLIVEWPSADRGALEAQARKGLIVVRYVGCEMQVLTQCAARAKYSYVGITRKKDRVSIRDADELYSNIPVGAAKFEAKLQRAGELGVDMVMVGRLEADTSPLHTNELEGECAQATHVISGVTVGAFTFYAGSESQVGGGASGLGVAAGARSSTKRETLAADGEEGACDKATRSDKAAPEGCGALLRVEVTPIGAPTCRLPWLRWDGTTCARAKARNPKAAECAAGKFAECEKSCEDGDPLSCVRAGYGYSDTTRPTRDDVLAQAYFDLACGDGSNVGCGDAGFLAVNGRGTSTPARGLALLRRSCDGGYYNGCSVLGRVLEDGILVPKDLPGAVALRKRACDLDGCTGCNDLGWNHFEGNGTPKDIAAARVAWERTRTCISPNALGQLGWLHHTGEGGARDEARATLLLTEACTKGSPWGCEKLKVLKGGGEPPPVAAPASPVGPQQLDTVRKGLAARSEEVRQLRAVAKALGPRLAASKASGVARQQLAAEIAANERDIVGYEGFLRQFDADLSALTAAVATGATSPVRLRDLEQRIDELKDQIRRTHTRLALLRDTILAGGP